MRMGKLNTHERHLRKTPPKTIPKYSSQGIDVGRVSSNLIASIYTPKFIQLATVSLEQYADELLRYQNALRAQEAEVSSDGTVDNVVPPTPPLFRSQQRIDDFTDVMTDTSKHFSAPKNAWKVHVNAAKFERMLDEKYGILRPFITRHPQVEVTIRSLQRKYAMGYFSPFRQGDPPIPRTTAVIILFMMQRQGVRWDALLLAALFTLVGLQPWALITIVALVHHQLDRRKRKLLKGMNPRVDPVEAYYHTDSSTKSSTASETKRKMSLLLHPVGTKLEEETDMSPYDTMILGSGPGALYTAALLSRAGRNVLVLSGRDDASGCLEMQTNKKYKSVPFDVDASNVARIGRQQQMLAHALCTSTDYQGGIRFAQVGSNADGHAFEILSIPGMGGGDEPIPFILRANGGAAGLMDDAATTLGDGWPGTGNDIGNSLSGAYLQACAAMNATAGEYFLSRVLSDSANDMRSQSTYHSSAIRHASAFLDKCFPLNAHLRSLFAGIGMKEENIAPSATSMGAHVTNVCSSISGEGMHYPIGGPRALCHALATVVEQCGGKVMTGANVQQLLFEETTEKDKPPSCIGVKLATGQTLKFTKAALENDTVKPAVVSMYGFVHTFIRIMPETVRTAHKVPRGLPALTEQRPVFKILIALKGSAEDLDVTGADYYRLPGASLAMDEKDPTTGEVKFGRVGSMILDSKDSSSEHEAASETKTRSKKSKVKPEEPAAAEEADVDTKQTKKSSSKKLKFDTGSSWIKISFPSAKDPTFCERHGNVTTCVVTIEADDDFVVGFDTKPKLFSIPKDKSGNDGNRQRLLERVQKDLLSTFPQLEGQIDHVELRGPLYRGLSHNPERYAAKGIRADTPFPGLYMGGADLTVGDSFSGSIVSGWLAANSIMGYSPVDLVYLKKNITADLEQFIPFPDEDEDDVAVPYSPPSTKEPIVASV